MQPSGKSRARIPRDFVLLPLTVVAVVVMTIYRIGGSQAQISAISQTEPLVRQDGTAAHPYSDASQCPPSTDIIIWPEEWRSIPSIPREFSVCFVSGQPRNNNVDADLKASGR
jgi:hypothetical protein